MRIASSVNFRCACAVFLIGFILLNASRSEAQTNPTPHSLGTSNYLLSEWASSSPAGTYPANMLFHTGSTANPSLASPTTGDYTLAYNQSAGPRIAGLALNGFYFATTNTGVPSVGAAVLSLNSVGRTNITVGFQSATHLAGNPASLRLQYRLSIYAPWTDVPGPVEFVSNGATSVNATTFSLNLSALTSGAVDNRPGLQLRWKFYHVSGTGTSSAAIRLNEIAVNSDAISGSYISTGQVSDSIYCLTPTAGRNLNIPFQYGPVGSFPAGATFIGELSDASGSFSTPTNLSNVNSNGSGNQVLSTTLPANTPSGTSYRVRIRTSNPLVNGNDNGSNITISRSPTDVLNAIVYAGAKSAFLYWSPPSSCWDEIMLIGKSGNNHSGTPSGNGSAYTANSIFGLGTAFGGGFVVYKGTGNTATITGLQGDTTYTFTIWVRYNQDWIGGTALIVTPPFINPSTFESRRITQAEFFWGSDPGQGNGIPLIALDGQMNQALEQAIKDGNGIPGTGVQSLSIRCKTSVGTWGPRYTTTINTDVNDVDQLTNLRKITTAEFFWNTDPGQGNGTPLLVFDGSFDEAIEQLTQQGVQAPKNGTNLLAIRVKDSYNQWSPVYSTTIHVDSVDVMTTYTLRKVTVAEYFWNSDPGNGNGTPLIALDGNLNQALETLVKSGVQAPKNGQNTFNIRVKDRDNTWGPAYSTIVNVDSVDVMTTYALRKVSVAEYFWNSDPGSGNGTTLIALDGNLNQAVEKLIKSGIQAPKNGQNTFNIRVKDRDNAWGPVFSTVVNVDSVDVMNSFSIRKITQAEFYWNIDPGQGNGTALLAFDGALNQALEQAIKQGVIAPQKGQNVLAIRMKDRDNSWGPDYKTIINIDSVDVNLSYTRKRIRRVEYFFDLDPGVGSGTLMNMTDGYGDFPLEQTFRNGIALLPNGVHLLGVRSQDRDNNWGPVYKTTISIDTLAQNSFQVYTNPSYTRKCAGQSVNMRALGAISYVWSPAAGLNTTIGDSVIATPQTTTTYMVVGTNSSSQKDTAYVTIEVQEPATITTSGPLVFCQGQTVTLTSNVPFGNTWNTGATTQSITVGTTGTWIVATDNECGVTFDTITTINQTPVLTSTQDNVTCNGGSNGSITVNVVSDTIPAQYSPGLLISELHTNPAGNDSPFEWVELVATDYLNFSQTPFTVVFSNNSPATAKGWMQGGVASPTVNSTYAFQITSGSTAPGDVVYVGGSAMAPTGTKLRVINTATTAGDGGLGGANLVNGVLGNGGGLADGIAVFQGLVSTLDSNSVPKDAIFFGSSIGAAAMADTSRGFVLPNNDRYGGGRLRTSSFFAPDPLTGFLRATGVFNRTTGVFTTPRVWSTSTSFTNALSAVSVNSNIQYVWSNGSPTKGISGLSAGSYTVTVTSAIGCTTTATYQVTQPTPLGCTFNTVAVICNGGNNGASTAQVVGGVAPYSFLWSNGATSAGVSGLVAGNYTVTVTDASGCTLQSVCVVTQPPPIVVNTFQPVIGNAGTSVTLKGSGFTNAAKVYFNTTLAASFTLSGDTQIVVIVPSFASTGSIKVVNSAGCQGLSPGPFQFVMAFANLHIKMFIEALYLGNGIMEPAIVNAGVSSVFTQVDTVTAFIADPLSPGNILHSENGILDIYGDVYFNFPGIYIGQAFFIGIRHRNSIETWSKIPVTLQQQTYYDFTQ